MIEQRIRIISESLARATCRRLFLKRAGEATFAGLIALAAGQAMPSLTSAKGRSDPPTLVPNCAPPGPFCNTNGLNEPNGCHGGSCFQHRHTDSVTYQCRVYYLYQAGCWTTASTGGYWTCCDCECPLPGGGRVTCGCAQFSSSPIPRPDGPGTGKV